MIKSGIDIVVQVFQMLNQAVLRDAIAPGKLWQHNIPMNSPYTEVVVSIPVTEGYESELKYFDVDIRTPNLGVLPDEVDYYPHVGLNQDTTFPDLAEFKRVTDIILPLIQTTGDLYVETKIPGVPVRDTDGMWRVTIRVAFTQLDSQDTHEAQMVAYVGAPDGAGGYVPVPNTVWTGTARRTIINENPHLEKHAGVYAMYLRSTWLVPADEVTPQKNMQLHTDEGQYVITGIFPEGIFWRLTTARKDMPNA